MDVSKLMKASGKQSAVDATRRPLDSPDDKNGSTRRSQTREVSSRSKSPTPSAAGGPKRCPSPSGRRTSSSSTVSVPNRAISAERKRPSTPSPPSTPVKDTTAEVLLTPRKTVGNRLQESLWPSTMRSLSVSFQSDNFAVPIGKREKVASQTQSDRTPRPSSNLAWKGEAPVSGKPKPESKRSPLKGKNSADQGHQAENSRPIDSSRTCLVNQHRWPSRTSAKTSTSLSSGDANNKVNKISSLSNSRTVSPSMRRLSLDGPSRPLKKSSSDFLMLIPRLESRKEMWCGSSVDDGSPRIQRPRSSSSSDRMSLVNAARAQSLSAPGSRAPSPSASRGISPSRAKVFTPPSRGTSPTRIRPPSPSRQHQNSTSVLSFIADIKKGKKTASNIEDAHQLRLLYNRHLQWRFANARTVAALQFQKAKAEKMLYNIWRIIKDLLDSVMEKRSDLQQLRLKLKLYSVLINHVTFLDEWACIERDHTNSLAWAIQDLQASTLRISLTEGAKGDIESVKAAVCSAVDVMKTVGSSLCPILSKMEGMNSLVSELADEAARGRALLNECESLFGSMTAVQVEEHSLRTHLLQMQQPWTNDEMSVFGY